MVTWEPPTSVKLATEALRFAAVMTMREAA